MRRWIKGTLITVVILLAIGLISLFCALGMGATSGSAHQTLSKYWSFLDSGKFHWGDDGGFHWGDDGNDTDITNGNTYEFQASELRKMDLEVAKAKCRIYPAQKGEEDKIKIVIDRDSIHHFEVSDEDETLKLECRDSHGWRHTARIEIYLPDHIQWEKVTLSAGAGQLTSTQTLYTDEMKLEVGASDVKLDQVKAEKFKAEIGAGQVEIPYLDAQDIKLEADAGKAQLGLPGDKKQYRTNISCAAGEVKFGDETYAGLANSHSNNPKDAVRDIKLECAAGSIIITFKEAV